MHKYYDKILKSMHKSTGYKNCKTCPCDCAYMTMYKYNYCAQ